MHFGRTLSNSKADPYQQFLRAHKGIAAAADEIFRQIEAFSGLTTPADFKIAIQELQNPPDSPKTDSKLHEFVRKRLPTSKIDAVSIRRFALVSRAAEVIFGRAVWHHQIACALLLSRGYIVQMPNGCGKTLAVALAAAESALANNVAHLATMNDYLAERDARWMGPFFQLLGLTVGVMFTSQSPYFSCGVLEPDGITLRVAPPDGSRSKAETSRLSKAKGEMEVLPLEQSTFGPSQLSEPLVEIELQYDDVMYRHREAIYALRRQLFEGADQKPRIMEMAERLIAQFAGRDCPGTDPEAWNANALAADVSAQFNLHVDPADIHSRSREDVLKWLSAQFQNKYQNLEDRIGSETLRQAERIILQNVIQSAWNRHLTAMRALNRDIPPNTDQASALVHYKAKTQALFDQMMNDIASDSLRYLSFLRIEFEEQDTATSNISAAEPAEPSLSQPFINEPETVPPIDQPSGSHENDSHNLESAETEPSNSEAGNRNSDEPEDVSSSTVPPGQSTADTPSPNEGSADESSAEPVQVRSSSELRNQNNGNYYQDWNLTIQNVLHCDIVYGKIEAFGFQYLRDNQAQSREEQTLTRRDFLIVDECDSVLLDDLRLPLIIEATTELPSFTTHSIHALRQIAALLIPGVDFITQDKSVSLTYEGLESVRRIAGRDFFNPELGKLALGLVNAIAAAYVYHRDEDYVVRNSEVILLEHQSGRLLFGRRYSGGLHQAIEAKEGLPIAELTQNEITGQITIKNFVGSYLILAGTSGTIGPPGEYRQFYGLETVEIEPYASTRNDHSDLVYRTAAEKVKYGVLPEAIAASQRGQPVLINVPTLREVAEVSAMLAEANVPHQALDADTIRTLGEEAERIERAGTPGLITVCSKMAARGTDIRLTPEALTAGGLYVIGLGRDTDRRYDDQLRGRAGRHGDPGESLFVLSLQDELLSIFGNQSMQSLMRRLGMEEGVPVEGKLISKRIRSAQLALRRRNREQRFLVVQRDDILDRHRFVFYRVRQNILTLDDCSAELETMLDNWTAKLRQSLLVKGLTNDPAGNSPQLIFGRLSAYLEPLELGRVRSVIKRNTQASMVRDILGRKLKAALKEAGTMGDSFKALILKHLDNHWRDYLKYEASAREEIQLYSAMDPTGPAKYAEAMEQRFDLFFYEAGEAILFEVLASTVVRNQPMPLAMRRASGL